MEIQFPSNASNTHVNAHRNNINQETHTGKYTGNEQK